MSRIGDDARPAAAASARVYARPWAALAVAAAGYAVTALLVGLLSAYAGLPGVIVDLAVTAVPLMAAVVVGVWIGRADGFARGIGVDRWRWADAFAGIGVAMVVRAAVELTAPTTGAVGGFGADVSVVLALVTAVAVSPVVEEVFFRGLVQRALDSVVGVVAAVLLSTLAFVGLHAVAAGGISLGMLVATVGTGIGCGVLTAVTGRLGGAIVAHVVFNAIGVGLLFW